MQQLSDFVDGDWPIHSHPYGRLAFTWPETSCYKVPDPHYLHVEFLVTWVTVLASHLFVLFVVILACLNTESVESFFTSWVVSTLAVCDMISMVRMQPAAGQLQVAATRESTCTGFGQDTDVLHLKKWIFGVGWCCSQHLSAHWSLKRVEVTFRWCGYDKTGSYMLLFLTSGSLLQIKLSWFIENNADVIFNQKLMSYYIHRWLSSSFWDPCWAQTLFSVLTDLTR